VNFAYSIIDPDNVNNGFSVTGCDNTVTGEDGNITCQFDTVGLHTVTLTASDGYLNSAPVSVKVNVLQGNVPPTLFLNAPETIDIDTMTSQTFSYIAHDLNGDDTFDVKAESSDDTIVKVSVDKTNSTITLLAQPKIGTATVTVYAVDTAGAKSKVYTLTVNTHNTLAELIPTLYLVPALDDNGNLIDKRYQLSKFNASYDINDNEVLINGEINTSKGEVTLTNFALNAYPDDGVFAGKDANNDYGFIFSNGFSYDGQFKDGRVLVFEENGGTPYYWALATPEEICNAFGENNATITLINSLNDKEPIDCSK
jgi:hypothetical protein